MKTTTINDYRIMLPPHNAHSNFSTSGRPGISTASSAATGPLAYTILTTREHRNSAQMLKDLYRKHRQQKRLNASIRPTPSSLAQRSGNSASSKVSPFNGRMPSEPAHSVTDRFPPRERLKSTQQDKLDPENFWHTANHPAKSEALAPDHFQVIAPEELPDPAAPQEVTTTEFSGKTAKGLAIATAAVALPLAATGVAGYALFAAAAAHPVIAVLSLAGVTYLGVHWLIQKFSSQNAGSTSYGQH